MGFQDALLDAVIEKIDELVIEAADVDEERRLLVQAERLPGEHLEHLFECAEASGKHEKSISQLTHHGFASVHVGGDVQLGQGVVRYLEIYEQLGDDADDASTVKKRRLGDGAHQADVSAAVDQTNVLLGERTAKLDGCSMIGGVYPIRGGAKDSNVADHIVRISIARECVVNCRRLLRRCPA